MKIDLQKTINTALKVTATCLMLVGAFLVYMVLVGIPRTAARNFYNHGIVSYTQGNISEAKAYWQEGLQYWPEAYIQEALLLN